MKPFGYILFLASVLLAQDHKMDHMTRAVHGVPGGVPDFCPNPNALSVANGNWSDPSTWSSKRVPAASDRVVIAHAVFYDVMSDTTIACIDVRGHLAFRTNTNTRLKTNNIMVQDSGYLEIGSVSNPIRAGVTAEVIIADQKIDRKIDPAELGAGIESLGKITMHGAAKLPAFIRLQEDAVAGQTALVTELAVTSWQAGDQIAIPDTRQLRDNERGDNYQPQDERLEIAAVNGNQITLTTPLKFAHKGARDADGKPEFLPHIGNLTRNVVIRSENPAGTRGHMIFMARADVDLRYVEVREMGRTRLGVLDNTEFAAQGNLQKLGTNQIGRYAIHFHHDFGPTQTPTNGYQFTLVGNVVDSAPKWGVTVHNSHFGLIQDNVVYNTHGAGIVTEDGTETGNLFDHNFALRSGGSGDFAPRSGYSGPGPDPGGEGAGFWFRGSNNFIRNNVAANADTFGFGLAAGALGNVRVPLFRGADTSKDSETKALDTTDAALLEFTGNEAYGAVQTGLAVGWNGEVRDFRVWNTSRHGITATPTDRLVVDGLTARGDQSILSDEFAGSTGVWVGNYISKNIVIRNADVQGMRLGVQSPFFRADQKPEPGRGDGLMTIENGHFRDYVGVSVATSYRANSNNDKPLKQAVVRSSTFAPLNGVTSFSANPPAAISMNYRMAPGDTGLREPIFIYDFNRKAGDNFKVYYSLEAPQNNAPCNDQRPEIAGWTCK